MTTGNTIALTFVGKVMSLLFNMLSRFVITYLLEQASFNCMATVTICSDFGAPKNKVCHCFHCFPIYLPWSDGTRCHDLSFLKIMCLADSWSNIVCINNLLLILLLKVVMNVPFHNSFYSQLQLSLHLFIKLKIIYTIDNTIFLYSLSRISKMVKIKCHINTLLALVISN